jgi:hypothetical protein
MRGWVWNLSLLAILGIAISAEAGVCPPYAPYYCPSVNTCYSTPIYTDCYYSPIGEEESPRGGAVNSGDRNRGSASSPSIRYAECQMDTKDNLDKNGDVESTFCKYTGKKINSYKKWTLTPKEVAEDDKTCDSTVKGADKEKCEKAHEVCSVYSTMITNKSSEVEKVSCELGYLSKSPSLVWLGSLSRKEIAEQKSCEGKVPADRKRACGEE